MGMSSFHSVISSLWSISNCEYPSIILRNLISRLCSIEFLFICTISRVDRYWHNLIKFNVGFSFNVFLMFFVSFHSGSKFMLFTSLRRHFETICEIHFPTFFESLILFSWNHLLFRFSLLLDVNLQWQYVFGRGVEITENITFRTFCTKRSFRIVAVMYIFPCCLWIMSLLW